MAPITQIIGGVTVTIDVLDNSDGTATVTWQAPPGIVGNEQTVNMTSTTVIYSGGASNGCNYSIKPSGELTWGEVENKSQIHWSALCQA